MNIRILSDLHLEFEPFEPVSVNCDVVVLAGDISTGVKGVEWAARTFGDIPIVYVAGNHEFYGGTLQSVLRKLQATANALGVHFLHDSSVTIDGVRFLGSTLWTNYDLNNDRFGAMDLARTRMSDFRRIRTEPSYSKLRPIDTVMYHERACTWLRGELVHSVPTVVVTHHAPSRKSVSPLVLTDPLSAAYASNLEEMVSASQARLWIHGHTHMSGDYLIGNTRVVSNQRGYPDQQNTGYVDGIVWEV